MKWKAQKIAEIDAKAEQYRTLRHYQRTANRLFQQNTTMETVKDVYRQGILPAVFPLPSLYCFSLISNKVDERACEMNATDMLLSMLR